MSNLTRMQVRKALKKLLPRSIFGVVGHASRLAQQWHTPGYVVGGFVRDLLLDQRDSSLSRRSRTQDLDLVVEGDGIAFARALAKPVAADVVAHPRFGTAVVIFRNGLRLDVATARSEHYESPAALPTVSPGTIEQDLLRRDFTINALAIRLDGAHFGNVVDYFGGQRDLQNRTLRVLHRLSFVEDPTRIFRAIRFEQRHGFRLDKETLSLLQQSVKSQVIHRLSASRLRQELILLLSENEPRKAVVRLAELNLLQFVHPHLSRSHPISRKLKTLLMNVEQAVDWYKVTSLNWQRQTSEASVDMWLVYVAALLDILSDRALRETLKRLQFPRREAEILRLSHAQCDRLRQALGRQGIRPSQVYRLLSGLPDELLLFLLAKAGRQETKQQIRTFMSDYRLIKPLLSGTELKAMGLKPGPVFKRLLERLRAARLDGEVKTEEEERTMVRKLAKIKD